MTFTLHMISRTGERSLLYYDPHTSKLTHENGVNVILHEPPKTPWETTLAVSKDNPSPKVRSPQRLKIQLGLGCNYTCSYCLQGQEIHKAAASSTNDAKIFLQTLDTWLEGSPQRIELWGGEPLLYWKKFEILVPELKRRFPDAAFSTVTNGTLLTKEIVDKLDEWDFSIGLSHDGPGQSLRGPDPFEDPVIKANIDYAAKVLGPKGKMSFNAVLTSKSYDVEEIIKWFRPLYPDVTVSFEGVVHDYNGEAESRFTAEQLSDLTSRLALQLIYGTACSGMLNYKIHDFIQSVLYQRPSSALWQKCGMDRPDSLAVDLLGNITTCQNVGGQGEHRIGHVRSMDKAALTTSTHWSHKEECQSCPVLQLCKGSCMYQEGDQWAASCHAEFALNSGILAGALFMITGLVLERISGDIVRPVLPQ